MKEIYLTQTTKALVDDEDFELLLHHKWHLQKVKNSSLCYASNEKGKSMHRFLLKAMKGEIIDHKNGNGLDNRKENLRFCSHSQNMHNRKKPHNRSGYRGVTMVGGKKNLNHGWIYWRAVVRKNGKRIYFGPYKDKIKAALAYDKAIKEIYGEFARTNF